MKNMKIRGAKSVSGKIMLPGDKSISHRAAMLASMAVGTTRIDNFATSADCASTLNCVESLGVQISRDGNTVFVDGVGKSGYSAPSVPLDCGNSGTTMRLISGILAGQNFESVLIGDESLQKRPMKRVIDPLGKMGVDIHSNDGMAPLTIAGRNPVRAIEYEPPVASAQIKSCVLLAGLNSDGKTTVVEKVQTRDHTERMLRWFGVDVESVGGDFGTRISVSGNAALSARDLVIPADISSAAFFLVAAVCMPGSDITMPNVGLNPSRRAILDVLCGLGVDIEMIGADETSNEPTATLRVRGGIMPGNSYPALRGEIIANLIDEIPIIAILGTQLDAGIEVRDAAELRVKESDRIAAVVENLRRMRANVTEFPDGFRVERSNLSGAVIETYGDHRISMAFAIAGLLASGETVINGAECANVSFPGFFETLASVVR